MQLYPYIIKPKGISPKLILQKAAICIDLTNRYQRERDTNDAPDIVLKA
jgi:hypothetical protein